MRDATESANDGAGEAVRHVFPDVASDSLENALVFSDPSGVIEFVSSLTAVASMPEERRREYLDALAAHVAAIIGREGTFRVPTAATCDVARV